MKKVLLLAAVVLLAGASGCGASAGEYAALTSSTAGYSYNSDLDSGKNLAQEFAAAPLLERKVIRTASFELETKEYEDTMRALEQQIAATGSYIERSRRTGDPEQGNARADLTIRVPEAQFEAFPEFLPSIGNVVAASEGGEDVTSQYFDTEARLKVLRAQEERLLALLEKADTVEELLQIENELTRIRTEIEQLTTTLKRYDDLVSYATISLYVSQTRDYTVPGDGFFSRLGKTVQDSFRSVAGVLQSAIFVLIWTLPYLLLALAVFLVVWFSLKRRRARNPKLSAPPQAPPDAAK